MNADFEYVDDWQALIAKADDMAIELDMLSEGPQKMRQLLDYGWFCCNNGLHMRAVDAFRDVFDNIPYDCSGEQKQLFDEAFDGLWKLHSSDDEYTWERTGVIFDYIDWCEEQSKHKR